MLWLVGYGGICRFDGARFHPFVPAGDKPVVGGSVTTVEPDGERGLWTSSGARSRTEATIIAVQIPVVAMRRERHRRPGDRPVARLTRSGEALASADASHFGDAHADGTVSPLQISWPPRNRKVG